MRYLTHVLLLGLAIGSAGPAHAQQPEWVDQLLAASRLPLETAEARREGVSNGYIREVLEAMRTARVPAHEAVAVIDTARAVHREHGPVDNFGAFVQAQLASGKRGRDLAAAIRAEHARSGKGHGTASTPGARGRSDAAGARDSARGRSEAAERRDSARGRLQDADGRGKAQTPGRPPQAREKPESRGKGAPANRNP
jgi:hypothetical protein